MADPKIRYDILANAQGAESVDRLATELLKLDDAVDPAVAARAQQLAQQLREIGEQQAAVQRFRDLKEQTLEARTALDAAQAAAQKLGQELAASETPTRAQTGQMAKLRDAVQAAKTEVVASTAALDAARGNLSGFGIAVDGVGAKERELRTAVQAVRVEVQQLGQQGQAVQRFQELGAATDLARSRLVAAETALESYRSTIVNVAEPTAAESRRLNELSAAARSAQIAFQQQAQAQAAAGTALRAAGVDTERLVAAQGGAKFAMTESAAAAQRLAASYRADGAAATESAAQQTTAHRRIRDGVSSISQQLDQLKNISIAGILGGQTAQLLKSVAETADAYSNLSARVRLVTGDGAAFTDAMEGIYQVATRTSSSLEGTATLFTRIAQAGKEIGVSQKDALALTESINQAVQLSGGSAEAADAAVTQLIQGLQSGVLRGEEFNSVMEQAPRLAQALAAGLHVTTGELRGLANEGKLTSATVIQALRDQSATLQKEFGSLPATIGRAITNLNTEWAKFVGNLNSSTGATATVASGINLLAANLDTVAGVAERAGAVLVAALAIKGAAAVRAFAVEATAAAGSANLLGASISKIPTVINITVAAVGFEIGFQIGEMLRENSALARQLGVGIVAFFENVLSDLQLVKEAAAAVFTDDTIDKAFARYRERGKQLDETFSDMWKSAEGSPERVATAAGRASDAMTGLGAAGAAVGGQISSGAAAGAGAVQGVGQASAMAEGALRSLAEAAKVNLPVVGATAADQVKALTDVAAKGGLAAEVLRTQLPAAIEKLSGAELEKFRAGFVGALEQSITASRRLASELQAAGDYGGRALADAARQSQLLQQVLQATGQRAAEALGVDVAGASRQVSKEFATATENLSVLVRTLPTLKAAGVDTASVVGQAIGKMIDGAKNQAEIDAIISRLKALGTDGVIGPQAVAGAMQEATEKAAKLKEQVEDATPGIQSLGEAARKAGVDFDQLTTGVSKGFADGVRDVTNLADQVERSGVSAQRAAPLLAAAIDQRANAAKTREELELVQKTIEELGAKSPQLAQALGGALAEVKRKAQELSPAIRQAQADAERLGITLRDNVQQGADAGVEGAIRAYERLKTSGKASAAELDDAFINVAKEAIAAADGIVPEWVKVEAAARNATIAVDDFGNVTIEKTKAAGQALNQLAGSFSDVYEAATKARKAADFSVLGNTDASGFTVDSAGNRIGSQTQVSVRDGSTFDNAAFLRDSRVAALTGGTPPDPNNPRYLTGGAGLGGTRPTFGYGGFGSPPAAAPAPPAPTAAPSAAPATIYHVNATIGGKSYGIGATSKAQADAMLAALEAAYSAAGAT